MMGSTVPSLDIPVTKGVSGVLALAEDWHPGRTAQGLSLHPVRALPGGLPDAPQSLAASACWRPSANTQQMAGRYHLDDCFECGCCSYVCPSNIPLVQQFRIAKAFNREQAAAAMTEPAPGAAQCPAPARRAGRGADHAQRGAGAAAAVARSAIYLFGLSAAALIVVVTAELPRLPNSCSTASPAAPARLGDYSAAITGMLLALTLPPAFPLWMGAVSGFVAIAPRQGDCSAASVSTCSTRRWSGARSRRRRSRLPSPTGHAGHAHRGGSLNCSPRSLSLPFMAPPESAVIDVVTGATPLATYKTGGRRHRHPRSAARLHARRGRRDLGAADPDLRRLPAGAAHARLAHPGGDPAVGGAARRSAEPVRRRRATPVSLYMLFSGGLMLGAWFMATDMVGTPVDAARRVGLWHPDRRRHRGHPPVRGPARRGDVRHPARQCRHAADRIGDPAAPLRSPARQAGTVMSTSDAPLAPPVSAVRMVAVLGTVAFLSGVLVVSAYQLALPRIQDNKRVALERALAKVYPAAAQRRSYLVTPGQLVPSDDPSPAGPVAHALYDRDGRLLGVAAEGAARGYHDTIRVLYAYSPDCQCITAINILRNNDTPGIGDKIAKDRHFLENFRALDVRLSSRPPRPRPPDRDREARHQDRALADRRHLRRHHHLARGRLRDQRQRPGGGAANPRPAASICFSGLRGRTSDSERQQLNAETRRRGGKHLLSFSASPAPLVVLRIAASSERTPTTAGVEPMIPNSKSHRMRARRRRGKHLLSFSLRLRASAVKIQIPNSTGATDPL
ncbi:MAG: RnfABCDGE type electron transport complex subunit D [Chromatiales bacterium]|nr:RnfABCDGE type electron transport complex subunit D [Chromatiales bacterium]